MRMDPEFTPPSSPNQGASLERRNNTPIIIAVAVIVLLCCCALAFAAIMYYWLGDLILEAIENALLLPSQALVRFIA